MIDADYLHLISDLINSHKHVKKRKNEFSVGLSFLHIFRFSICQYIFMSNNQILRALPNNDNSEIHRE